MKLCLMLLMVFGFGSGFGQNPGSSGRKFGTSVSAADYGAKCNGTADDTAALNAVLNTGAGSYTVTLPQGTCRITSPIVIITSDTNFPSLVGAGPNTSILQGDYSHWPAGPQAMIEINTTGKVRAVLGVHNRRFGGFSLVPSGTIGTHHPIGIEIKSTAAGITGSDVDDFMPLFNASIDHILFASFYQALSMTEGFNVNMSSLRGVGNANGISIAGESININIDACTFGNTSGTGIGIRTGARIYGSVTLAPQAVHVENGTAFVSYRTNAYLGAGLYVTLDHSVFDGATANSIVVVNSNNTFITSNYIESNNPDNAGVLIQSPPMHLDGLWIEDNFITGGANKISGIRFAPGIPRRGVHIIDNRLSSIAYPIFIASVPVYSEIDGNYGQSNTNPLITINDSGPNLGVGLSIKNNISSDPLPVIKGNGVFAPTYFQDNNVSAAGPAPSVSLRQVGYFVTTPRSSDTYTVISSPGALPGMATLPVGAHCYAQAADPAAAAMTGVYVAPLAKAGAIVLDHPPVGGAHFSIACASQ